MSSSGGARQYETHEPGSQTKPGSLLAVELCPHALVDDARVGLAAGLLHHRADEEADQTLLPAPVLLDLAGIRLEHPVDHRVELRRVGDRLLREVRTGAEAVLAHLGERLVEDGARDLSPRTHELRELAGSDAVRLDAGGDELVREHIGRLLRVGAGVDHVGPESVEPTGDEHVGVVERKRVGDPPDARARQLADLASQALDSFLRRVHRHEVRLREVAVVLRLLLGAHRRRLLVARHEVERLLLHLTAGLVDLDLPRDLALDSLRREVERVHVLQLGAGTQLVAALRAHRHVYVEAHRALLELGIREAELDDGLPQQVQEALRSIGVVDVGRRDDLDERRAATVEVHECRRRTVDAARGRDMHVLRSVLLEVRADDPDRDVAVRRRHDEAAVRAKRLVVLADLVRLRQVGIEVVLAVEHRALGNRAVKCDAELDALLDRTPVRDRQRAWERQADRAGLRVRLATGPVRTAAEHLRARLQRDVDLEPDHRLPARSARLRRVYAAHRKRSGTKSNSSARSSACPTLKSVFSPNCGPTSWRPTGSPAERPHGIERPGNPAMHDGIVSRSFRYIASGSAVFAPSSNATVGLVGETIRSKFSNTASC